MTLHRSKKTHILAGGILICLASALAASAAPETLNPLSSAEHWRAEPGAWTWEGDVLRGRSTQTSVAVVRDSALSPSLVVEAVVTPDRILDDNWKGLGIGVYVDDGNFWILSLIESPNANGSVREGEFSEMRTGQWLANESLEQVVDEGEGAWELGRSYRLRIVLEPGRIEGEIREADGTLIMRRAYRLDDKATAAGRPALRVVGVEGRFADLRAALGEPREKPAQVVYPPYESVRPWSGIKARKTGFFRVEEIDDRWWVIDPNGEATLGLAVDHVLYNGPWCTALSTYEYKDNNEAQYASRAEWEAQTLERLKNWKFNLMSIGEDASLRHRGPAHCIILDIAYRFSALGDVYDITPYGKRPGTMFPNVFHPDFSTWLDFLLEEICGAASEDPWLFGYLLDNELAWGGKKHGVWHGMFDAAMLKSSDHTAKLALRDHLRDEFGTVAKLNAAWNEDVQSWDELLERTRLGRSDNPEIVRVKEGYLAKAADTYFRLITEAVRRFDPNHMILGCRFAGGRANEDIWRAAGTYCDIVSFNYYGSVDLDTGYARSDARDRMSRPLTDVFTKFYEQCGRPMMLTEWAFIGLDADLPSTKGAGQRFRTQAERAAATEIYLSTMLRMPFMVGSAWFKHIDQPKLGIRPEFGENSNYGLVDVRDRPYEELVEAFTRVQSRAAELHMMGPVEGGTDSARYRASGDLPEDWTCADPSPERPPEPPLRFERRGEGFVASNGRLVIEAVDGAGSMTSRIAIDDLELGVYNAMLCQLTGGQPQWCGVNRLEDVQARSGEGCLEIELKGSWGTLGTEIEEGQTFEAIHVLTLLPERPWFAVRLESILNTSGKPLRLEWLAMQTHSAIGGTGEDDQPTDLSEVPRLWKHAPSAAWVDPEGGFFGIVAPNDGKAEVKFWVDPKGNQHPDALFPCNAVIAPGTAWRPPRPVWAVVAAGTGGRAEWEELSRKLSR